MRSLCIAALLGLGLSGVASAAQPPAPKADEFTTVTVKAEAAILDGDVAAAKEKAREVALRDAVNQVVGATISSMSETQDFALVRDVVFSHTAGYVRKYEIVGQKQEGETLELTVRAEVAKGAIDKDAAAISTLLAWKKQKRIYVMIDDVAAGKVGDTAAAVRHGVFDGVFREALRKDGFITLDPNLVDGKLKNKAGIQALQNTQAAGEIANALGADVIIYGNVVTTTLSGEVAGSTVFQAVNRPTISVVIPDSSETIADYVAETKKVSPASADSASAAAVREAAETAAKEVRARLFDAWRKQMTGSQRVAMAVTGLKDYGMLNAFKNILTNNVRGVKEISSVRFEKGAASMDLALSGGSTESLAAELSGKKFKGLTMSVTKVTGSTIEVALGK